LLEDIVNGHYDLSNGWIRESADIINVDAIGDSLENY